MIGQSKESWGKRPSSHCLETTTRRDLIKQTALTVSLIEASKERTKKGLPELCKKAIAGVSDNAKRTTETLLSWIPEEVISIAEVIWKRSTD